MHRVSPIAALIRGKLLSRPTPECMGERLGASRVLTTGSIEEFGADLEQCATTRRDQTKHECKTFLESYNQLLAPARERFETSPGLNAIRSTNDPRMLEAFLLYFCAIGAQMTEPVETWIRRAADRCAVLGLSDLAEAFSPRHAHAEAGHHLMDDCRSSVTGGSLELTTYASSGRR